MESEAIVENPTQIVYQKDKPVLVWQSVVVRVISGPDQGAICPMALHQVIIGSGPDNTLQLSDPTVSRRHLEIVVQDRGYLIRDLGSTNGTFYREARIKEVVVGVGAEIRLGTTVLRLESGEKRNEPIPVQSQFGTLIGTSLAMQKIYGLLAAVSPTDTTVLIEGETGTGKELVAEEIHKQSPRRERLFHVVDCGAIPPQLIEAELFGHEKGAFTGAVSQRIGMFERVRGGTIFLDEIGELPLDMQTRLLGVLDRRIIKRVGGDWPIKVDFRLIAATNRDLLAEVKKGTFRQDLYFRLSVIRIVLPPLRKRREDIPLLTRHFLWQAGVADPDTALNDNLLQMLSSRDWPGNVRELRNVIERAMVLADEDNLFVEPEPGQKQEIPASTPSSMIETISEEPEQPVSLDATLFQSLPASFFAQGFKQAKEQLLHHFETFYMNRMLEKHGSNISSIAREAGVDRHQVRRLLYRNKLNQ